MRFSLLIILIPLFFSSCFTRFVTTNRELKKYYRDKPVKPTYFTIKNDSVELFCATTGADTLPPLLLIHGAPGAWYGSRVFLDDSLLQKHFHIIAIDRPGYNKSRFNGKRKAVTSIEIQAIAIHEALRLNKSTQKGTIVGSSYGGPIAAKLVILYPDNFNHLVLLAAAIDPDKEKFWWFNKWVHHGPVRWLLPRFINHATDEKYSHVKELRKLLPDWQKIVVPVTVVQGGADKIVNPVNFEFAKTQLKNKKADFIFLPDAGHLIRWQRPELVKNILLHPSTQHTVNSAQ
jgi:pimeloyl-ACP methyl ester carboxylesterase